MNKWKCEKHGLLEPNERAIWSKDIPGRWCVRCLNELMDRECGKLILIKDEKGE